MPWQEANSVPERRHFIQDVRSGHWTMSDLCLRYVVSLITGYKWLDRYEQGAEAARLVRFSRLNTRQRRRRPEGAFEGTEVRLRPTRSAV